MAVNDIFKLTVVGKDQLNEPNLNTFYYKVDVDGVGSPNISLSAGWEITVMPAYRGCISNTWNLTELDTYRISSVNGVGALVRNTGAFPLAGLVVQAAFAGNLSIVVGKRTGLAGRQSRGRLFMPGVPATFITAGVVSAAGLIAYNALGLAMTQSFINSGFTWSPVLFNKRKPPIASFFTPIIDWLVNEVPRQVRRRETGVRIHPKKNP